MLAFYPKYILYILWVECKLLEKHDVSFLKAEEAFNNFSGFPLEDTREKHRSKPPTVWCLFETYDGRLLKIVYIPYSDKNLSVLRTAYEPDDMERKSMTKEELEEFARNATSDENQEKWESKELGADSKSSQKSKAYKAPSKLISIRVPEEVLNELKVIADKEGLRYQTYLISLLKKHVKGSKSR